MSDVSKGLEASPATAPLAPAPAWPLYRAMVGIGAVCGLLIVGVFQLTRPAILANQAEALAAAIYEVVPGATQRSTFVRTAEGAFVALSGSTADTPASAGVHAAYDANGRRDTRRAGRFLKRA